MEQWCRGVVSVALVALLAGPAAYGESSLPWVFHAGATAPGNGAELPAEYFSTVGVQIEGTFVGTVAFERRSKDGSGFFRTMCTNAEDGSRATETSEPGYWDCPGGAYLFRAPVTARSSGTIVVTGHGTTAVSSRGGGGSGATPSLQAVADVGRTIGNATSTATAALIGSSGDNEYMGTLRDPTLGVRNTCRIAGVWDACNKTTMVKATFRYQVTAEDGGTLFNFQPNAGPPNAQYALGTYPAQATFEVPLQPRGAAAVVTESLTTGHTVSRYLTVTDSSSDAVDFEFHVTNRMAGATTFTFRLYGVSTAASPSGNIALDCATTTYTPGTDTYGTHSATGAVRALLTPATQYRPVAVTTSSHTINGGPLGAGDMVRGSCVVHAGDTTSAQMANFRLHGRVAVMVVVNSLSD